VFFLLEGRRVAAESAAAQFQERLAQEFVRIDTLAQSYQALFAASVEVTSDEFRAFSAQVLPHATMLAQALYAPHITHAQRPAFENWLQEQGIDPPVITLLQPDGRRVPAPPAADYYPVAYLARITDLLDSNATGIDAFGTNSAGYRAAKSNRIYASDPVQLPSGVTVFNISVPVRERSVPVGQHSGVLLLIVKPMLLLDDVALPRGLSAKLSVIDPNPHHPDPTLWARASDAPPPPAWLRDLLHWESVRTLESNGRRYRLELQRNQALQLLDWSALLGSVLLSIGGIAGAVLLDRQRMQVVRAESTSRAKSEFLAIMSHEIRTPLNGIMGMAELLSRAELSAQERRYAEIIVNSGKSLLQIINDILDFSKIEAGRLELEVIDVNLEELIGELSELYSYSSYLKGISFSASMDPSCPRVIRGDPTRLRQVLLNLLSNAFKFTERGEVVLRVSLAGEQNGLPLIRFTVRDTGIGISDQVQRQLFAPFSQADSSTSRRYGGTGLGLTICQLLAGLMGGSISVRSAPGQGSEFQFSAPFAPGQPLPQGNGPELKDLAGQHVLIVDDFETARMIFAEQARCLGLRAEVASNCKEAWQLLNRPGNPFDLIITDLDMPTTDGIEFIRQLTQNPSTRDIPVYLMSASSSLNRRDIDNLG
ncbi:MAG TPA: ATP-binding protein, partial [Spongiibacteraceae bacterium]|nr:ATP-binding protein [Spongiibacteraceae bacterium]